MIDYEIPLGEHAIRGKLWGPVDGLPTIALHGYLDNANSFDRLAPLLTGRRVFAMDFAGHGESNRRQSHELYSGLSDIRDVLAVADHFNWSTFHILGHSMGAEIGSQLAGLFPSRVETLICLDGFCSTNDTATTLDNLASSVTASFKQGTRLKVFPTLDAMSQRLSTATGQSSASASAIVARGHRVVTGGFTWKTDPKIKGAGPLELTKEQLRELIGRLQARTLMIIADLSNAWLQRSLNVLLPMQRDGITTVYVPSHHHLHMQDEVVQVASLIERFDRGESLSSEQLSQSRYVEMLEALDQGEEGESAELNGLTPAAS